MRKLMLWAFMYLGSKLWQFVDVYSPDKENVNAITFSNDWDYIRTVSNVELKVSKVCETCIHPDGGVCPYAGEISGAYTCEKWEDHDGKK